MLEAVREAAVKKRNTKIVFYCVIIIFVLIVPCGYYSKAKEAALIQYVETDPAITTGYVEKFFYTGKFNICPSICYHYDVDGKRFNIDDRDLINIHWRWIFPYGEEADCGDSILIKYNRKDPSKHIRIGILR